MFDNCLTKEWFVTKDKQMKINIICRNNIINKNGASPLCLRFTHNRTAKLISLGIAIPSEYWDAEQQTVSESCPNWRKIQLDLDSKLQEYEKKIHRLETLGIEVNFDTLFETKNKLINCTVIEYFNHCIERFEALGKIGTAAKYRCCLSLLNLYCSEKTRFEEIDLPFLQNMELFLRKRGNSSNDIATKFSVFKAVYNKALADGLFVSKNDLFKKFKVGSLWTPTRKRAITKEDISKLIGVEVPNESREGYKVLAKNIFLFSYFTAGMNFKDIACLRYGDILNDRVYYARHKTKKEMSCRLIAQVKEIIATYSKRDYSDEDYIFPILEKNIHITEQQIFNRLHKALVRINQELKKLGKEAGIKLPLSTYVARHTFATVLKRSGVDVSIISEALGHSDITTTKIYLDSFENSQIDKAMENLL